MHKRASKLNLDDSGPVADVQKSAVITTTRAGSTKSANDARESHKRPKGTANHLHPTSPPETGNPYYRRRMEPFTCTGGQARHPSPRRGVCRLRVRDRVPSSSSSGLQDKTENASGFVSALLRSPGRGQTHQYYHPPSCPSVSKMPKVTKTGQSQVCASAAGGLLP